LKRDCLIRNKALIFLLVVLIIIKVYPVDANADFSFITNYVALNISQQGQVTFLMYNNVNHLSSQTQLSILRFDDERIATPISFSSIGNNRYEIRYIGSNVVTTLEIIPRAQYILFKILGIDNPSNEQLEGIELFHLHLINVPINLGIGDPQIAEWARNASQNELFLNALPLNQQTACGLMPDPLRNQYGYRLRCIGSTYLQDLNLAGALQTAPKSEYWTTLQQIISENGLPNVLLADGRWLRTSNELRRGYFFATIKPQNYQALRDLATRGGFKYFMLLNPVYLGNNNRSIEFSSTAEFISAVNYIRTGGFKIGVHTFLNQVDLFDGLVSFANPPANPDYLKNALMHFQIGTLQNQVTPTDTSITLNEDLSQNSDFRFLFSGENSIWGYTFQEILIDNEIITCASYSGNQLQNCQRPNRFGIPVVTHAAGRPVYLVFREQWTSFYLNPNNATIRQQSATSFANFANQLDIDMLYWDGDAYPAMPRRSYFIALEEKFKVGMSHYLEQLTRKPLFQFAGGGPSFGWYWIARTATDDGPAFKEKQFTQKWKVLLHTITSPFSQTRPEFGWWRIVGAEIGSGKWDFDATSSDDLNHVMLKVLAFDSSIGLELNEEFYNRHTKINDLLDQVRIYNNLIEQDIQSNIIPTRIKDHFKITEKEGELNRLANYNIVEKKVYRQYASWNLEQDYAFTINNPFANQKLHLEIRPRFDYYPFADARHLILTNTLNGATITKSNQQISCVVNGNTVTVTNPTNAVGGCRLSFTGIRNLASKRGVGISITGNNQNELVIVRLGTEFPVRDYKFLVDFTGRRDIILGDPTGDFNDLVNNITTAWQDVRKNRHWAHDFSATDGFQIFVNNVLPGTTVNLQIHEIKALQEKTGSLVNPRITLNGQTITFPVTLSISDSAPYFLEYNGFSRAYKLSNTNYQQLSSGEITIDNINIQNRNNQISFNSDLTSQESLARAELLFSVYDDADGDGIPTNGDYLQTSTPCGGNLLNFCDDNCPDNYNPDQGDSDLDGRGDACGGRSAPGELPGDCTRLADGTPCNDYDPCTSGEFCQNEVCGRGQIRYGGECGEEEVPIDEDEEEIEKGKLLNRTNIIIFILIIVIVILIIILDEIIRKRRKESEEA